MDILQEWLLKVGIIAGAFAFVCLSALTLNWLFGESDKRAERNSITTMAPAITRTSPVGEQRAKPNFLMLWLGYSVLAIVLLFGLGSLAVVDEYPILSLMSLSLCGGA